MTTKKDYADTSLIQEASLVEFAAALGYDPVYNMKDKLMRFKNPRLQYCGNEYKSVRTMIRLHNKSPDDLWNHISTVNYDFQTFVNLDYGIDAITTLFAGACKIVQTVKGRYKKGEGFTVFDTKGDHMISFMTDIDELRYSRYLEIPE